MAQNFDVEMWWKQMRKSLFFVALNPVVMGVMAVFLPRVIPALRQGGLASEFPTAAYYVGYSIFLLFALLPLLGRKRSIRYFLSKPLELEETLGLYRGLMMRNLVLSHMLATGGFVFFLLDGNLPIFLGAVAVSLIFSLLQFPRKSDLGMEIL